jgi:dephospho-CoA kinase
LTFTPDAIAMLRLGLTGGIGSGKSTVAALFKEHGAQLVDTDAIAHALTASGGAAMAAIVERFGAGVLSADGALDRARMRELVFEDDRVRLELQAIVHPLVGQYAALQAEAARRAGAACVVFDVPLLVESGHWRGRVDRIVVVDCSEATQVLRVRARNGWEASAVKRVIDAQATRAQRRASADAVIFNDGLGLTELAQQVSQLAATFGLSSNRQPAAT